MGFTSLFNTYGFRQWAGQFLVLFFLIAGFTLLLIGLSLIFNSAGALRLFGRLNRWVSMRQATRPLEIPRDTSAVVRKYRHWLAAAFVGGGVFALFGLLTQYDAAGIIYGLKLGYLRPAFAHWLFDSARWVLIVGNLAAIAIGIMLAFFPNALMALEASGSRWYSERRHARSRDVMHVTVLDEWVAEFPRASGVIITLFAVFLIGAFGMMVPQVRW
ncbi:MAG TPA: hypothetical protein VKF40_07835 [Burkholderiales bacterium]|nr:hypothetical protein [Burkholderiales bacterium]